MPRMTGTRTKTATAPDFSPDDLALLSESLRIAATDLEMTVLTLARVWPSSPLVEKMRVIRERMNDLRVNIDGQ